jgi:hypothetical protein
VTAGRIALVAACAAPFLIVAGLLVPDPWDGSVNAIVSGGLVLGGIAAALVALVAAPIGRRRSNGTGERTEALVALIALGAAAGFFGLLLVIVVSVEWS